MNFCKSVYEIRCIWLPWGTTSPFTHWAQSLLAQNQKQNNTSCEKDIEEECFSIQTFIHFNNVDGFIEDRFAVNTALL